MLYSVSQEYSSGILRNDLRQNEKICHKKMISEKKETR